MSNLLNSDEIDKLDKVQSTFWREWKLKLEEQKRLADHSRVLEKIIPGVETARFLSGDFAYIKSVVLSLIESVKLEKKHILKDVLKLADTYGLNHTEVCNFAYINLSKHNLRRKMHAYFNLLMESVLIPCRCYCGS